MRFDEETDTYTLTSGRTFYANHGIIGLDTTERPASLTEGYDGRARPEEGPDEFTAEERAEIADYVIAMWTPWKLGGQHEGKAGPTT